MQFANAGDKLGIADTTICGRVRRLALWRNFDSVVPCAQDAGFGRAQDANEDFVALQGEGDAFSDKGLQLLVGHTIPLSHVDTRVAETYRSGITRGRTYRPRPRGRQDHVP